MLKQFILLALAAVFGGLIAIALYPDPCRHECGTAGGSPAPGQHASFVLQRSPYAQGETVDFRDAARRATAAVVHIATSKGTASSLNEGMNPFRFFFDEEPFPDPFRGFGPQEGTGSGVIYTADGYILTNFHVVSGAERMEVTLSDNRRFSAELVGAEPQSDLALLKIDAFDLPVLPLADPRQAEVGEWVLAVGNPLELTSTVTAGIISAKGRRLDLLPAEGAIESFIQTDAAVNPGNSGGALVNTSGELLGINTAIASRTGWYSGYSFAIPINIVQRIADDLIQYGIFRKIYLGIDVSQLDAEYARELGLPVAQGVVVEKVLGDGSAASADLRVRDVIVSADGRAIRGVPDLQEVLASSAPGKQLVLEILRDGMKRTVSLTLQAK